ncbi:MAG: NAD(P)/FAD-dependent oxidoreductase [Pseudomonadota bacterium]
MSNLTRRHFLTLAAGTAAAGMAGYYFLAPSTKKKVVIIGGGAGGVIAAKYIRKADTTIDVTLIEQNKHYYTCFMSNEVLSGERSIDSIKYSYDNLSSQHGVNMVYDRAIGIEPAAKKVRLHGGETIAYDRLIVSPGIDFRWEAIDGYDANLIEKIPHAWKAGEQTIILRRQLEAMKDGGTVIIAPPPKPYRCSPAPYERASQIAHYLKLEKPKSKVLILDANQAFAKQALFIEGWKKLYGYGTDNSLIEWIPSDQGGNIVSLDADQMTVYAGEFEDEHTADVINIIPAQKAGRIAIESGLADDSGWCPINQKTFESTLHKDIHVIGDACIAGAMPKSGYSANSQAKVCAQAVISALQDTKMVEPSFVNTCYSVVGEDFAISVTGIYRLKDGKIEVSQNASGVSPLEASDQYRKSEVAYAYSWYKNMTHDMFD